MKPSKIVDAQVCPSSNVVQLKLKRQNVDLKSQNYEDKKEKRRSNYPMDNRPGDYVYIKCPEISLLEWHPFSLTSPVHKRSTNEVYSLHVQAIGDWSKQLKDKIELEKKRLMIEKSNLCQWKICHCNNNNSRCDNTGLNHQIFGRDVKIFVDGPFSSPTQDVFSFRRSICIAGGIGITPFLSVISFLMSDDYRLQATKLEKLHVIWIVKYMKDVSLMKTFFSDLQDKSNDRKHLRDLLTIDVYLTRDESRDDGDPKLLGYQKVIVTVGKPNVMQVLSTFETSTENERTESKKHKTGVFCCGPASLLNEVKETTRKLNLKGSRFVLKRENFG
jgi:predicted ferric reductase